MTIPNRMKRFLRKHRGGGLSSNIWQIQTLLDRRTKLGLAATARAAKQVAIYALGALQTYSPVDTGRYRANHVLTLDVPSLVSKPVVGGSPNAQAASDRMQEALQELDGGVDARVDNGGKGGRVVIYITNNVVYAGLLERGWSLQAPRGVYKLARRDANLLLTAIRQGVVKP